MTVNKHCSHETWDVVHASAIVNNPNDGSIWKHFIGFDNSLGVDTPSSLIYLLLFICFIFICAIVIGVVGVVHTVFTAITHHGTVHRVFGVCAWRVWQDDDAPLSSRASCGYKNTLSDNLNRPRTAQQPRMSVSRHESASKFYKYNSKNTREHRVSQSQCTW